jgi:selenocysteine-specific elongation factor
MRVIGTAGHVDHGKSTLVQAITGVHPDRLKEEREREMTIDLGFAWFTLADGEEVGIVDVPGHRDFIENMLAGVGGIDASLFVVAADEGVMPQTREHLSILDLLQVQGGVVALTKIDLIEDKDWLDLVEDDLRQVLAGTVLDNAPIVRVSARTGEGIPQLLSLLSEVLAERPPRLDLNRPRLPIDRVFTISGFGTVVTGTLSDGLLHIGDEVEILPSGVRGRVRGLQTHKRKEELAVPGSRTAINLSGVALEQVQRGDVVAHPGDYQPTRRVDLRFRLLPDASQSLHHNIQVKFFLGAAELLARVRLLGTEALLPGEEGWLQLELSQPVVAMRGDRYILRRPSPGETLGGGSIVDPHPNRRHKRFANETLARLKTLAQGSPAEILQQAMFALGVAPLQAVIDRSNLEKESALKAFDELLAAGQFIILDNRDANSPPARSQPDILLTSRTFWENFITRVIEDLQQYHDAYPLRQGMPREELKSRLKSLVQIHPRFFNAALHQLVSQDSIAEIGPYVRLPEHIIRFNPQQNQAIERLMDQFAASPYTPPSVKECVAKVGEEVFNALLEQKKLVAVGAEVVFRQEDYERMVAEVRRLIQAKGQLTAAEARDHFKTSRRYILALLEHLDAIGITIRDGDVRRLRR